MKNISINHRLKSKQSFWIFSCHRLLFRVLFSLFCFSQTAQALRHRQKRSRWRTKNIRLQSLKSIFIDSETTWKCPSEIISRIPIVFTKVDFYRNVACAIGKRQTVQWKKNSIRKIETNVELKKKLPRETLVFISVLYVHFMFNYNYVETTSKADTSTHRSVFFVLF